MRRGLPGRRRFERVVSLEIAGANGSRGVGPPRPGPTRAATVRGVGVPFAIAIAGCFAGRGSAIGDETIAGVGSGVAASSGAVVASGAAAGPGAVAGSGTSGGCPSG